MHEGHAVELPALLWAAGWLVAVLVLFAVALRLPLATGLGAIGSRLYAAGREPRRTTSSSRAVFTR